MQGELAPGLHVALWISLAEINLRLDGVARYLDNSNEQLACSATLRHYPKIGSIKKLPPETSNGLWSLSSLSQRKITARCGDVWVLCKTNHHVWYEYFKMEGFHTIRQLRRCNDLITKVDLSCFLHAHPHPQGRPPVHAVHVGGQAVLVHQHALRLSSGSETCHQDDDTGDQLSSIVRPSNMDLYR